MKCPQCGQALVEKFNELTEQNDLLCPSHGLVLESEAKGSEEGLVASRATFLRYFRFAGLERS